MHQFQFYTKNISWSTKKIPEILFDTGAEKQTATLSVIIEHET